MPPDLFGFLKKGNNGDVCPAVEPFEVRLYREREKLTISIRIPLSRAVMGSRSWQMELTLHSSATVEMYCNGHERLLMSRSIVAVHGLDGKREKSWTAKNNVNWLQDLLPTDIPQARIFSWGYEAITHSTSSIKTQTIYDHARNLVSDLCRERGLTEVPQAYLGTVHELNNAQTRRRPIIFVAHSLGGVVVKSVSRLEDFT